MEALPIMARTGSCERYPATRARRTFGSRCRAPSAALPREASRWGALVEQVLQRRKRPRSLFAAGGGSAWTLPKSAATIRPGQAALLGLAGFTLAEGIGTAVAGRDVQLAGGLALLIGGVVYALAMIGRLLGRVPEIRSLFAVVGTLLAAGGIATLSDGLPAWVRVGHHAHPAGRSAAISRWQRPPVPVGGSEPPGALSARWRRGSRGRGRRRRRTQSSWVSTRRRAGRGPRPRLDRWR